MRREISSRKFLLLAIFLGAVALHVLAGRAWSAEAALPDEGAYENVLGMKFVLIPAGEFLMGTRQDEVSQVRRSLPDGGPKSISDEMPEHRVRITRPILLAIHELTVEQFRKFVDATGYRTDAEQGKRRASGWNQNSNEDAFHDFFNWRNPGFAQGEDHPVVDVSWNDAQEFCRWLRRLEPRVYRLPTEAEWEYACRAGTTTWFSCGNDPEELVSIANVNDRSAWRVWGMLSGGGAFLQADDDYAFTYPVGKFRPNAWGLYDMHGNAWEWCQDWYGSGYYEVSPRDDPTGPTRGDKRICRGGSWGSAARRCRAAYRNQGYENESRHFIGFRVALEPKTASEEQR